jgi:adenine-specific DNA-methyltransferase
MLFPFVNFLLKIRVLAVDTDYFTNAEERIVLIWLFNYGKKNISLKLAHSKTINGKIEFRSVEAKTWLSRRVITSNLGSPSDLLNKLKTEYEYQSFKDIAEVKIGVVTGADDYFILNNEEIKKSNLDKRKLQPIINSFRNIRGFSLNGIISNQYLLKINKQNVKRFSGFLRKFRNNDIHLRAHSVNRSPWYSVIIGKIPDAFFPYRISKCPHLILNNNRFQSTNSIHRIYFKKKLSLELIKCLQLSFLTYPTQLSLESNSKVYGSGVLKIEPSSLKDSIIKLGNYMWINDLHRKVNSMLLNQQTDEALDLASEFFYAELNISKKTQEEIREAYKDLLSRRMNRTKI